MKLTTTFNLLHKNSACTSGYRRLARYLGSVESYGVDKPIDLLTVLDSNGVFDCIWCLRATKKSIDSKVLQNIVYEITEYGIRKALKVYDNIEFKNWAEKWLSGEDRTLEAAEAAEAAARAAAGAAAEAAEAAEAAGAAEAAARAAAEAAARAAEAAARAAEAAAGAAAAEAAAAEAAAAEAAAAAMNHFATILRKYLV